MFDEAGGADTATPLEMFSKDMNPDSTGSRMTEVYVHHQSAETRQPVAALTRATTIRPNVTLRLPGAATPTSLWQCA